MNLKTNLIQSMAAWEKKKIPRELQNRQAATDILNFLDHTPRPFHRETLEGHITASAFIVNPTKDSCVLLLHKKLKLWCQPGGHSDGDSVTVNVCAKEIEEETGLSALRIYDTHTHDFIPFSPYIWGEIFDIDVHNIPAFGKTPAHFHYDIRYLFLAENPEQLRCSDESLDVKWVKLTEVNQFTEEESIARMLAKFRFISF